MTRAAGSAHWSELGADERAAAADYDEVALIHGVSSLGRPLKPGLISHDPQGIHHGFPDRARIKARREWEEHSRIEWEIIMVEAEKPLKLDPVLLG